jgi:hypothetical protein
MPANIELSSAALALGIAERSTAVIASYPAGGCPTADNRTASASGLSFLQRTQIKSPQKLPLFLSTSQTGQLQ